MNMLLESEEVDAIGKLTEGGIRTWAAHASSIRKKMAELSYGPI